MPNFENLGVDRIGGFYRLLPQRAFQDVQHLAQPFGIVQPGLEEEIQQEPDEWTQLTPITLNENEESIQQDPDDGLIPYFRTK